MEASLTKHCAYRGCLMTWQGTEAMYAAVSHGIGGCVGFIPHLPSQRLSMTPVM